MPEQKETTYTLMANELIVYRRERSSIWQCRFKVDGIWQRASTKERDLKKAKQKARELMIEAEIRKRSNLPVVTRRFRDVAKLAVQRMDDKLKNKEGKVSYKDYTVFVNTKLKEELAAYVKLIRTDDKERTLFPTQKNPRKGFTANTMTQHFLCLYREAGIDGASSHSGRRTFATSIASKGTSLRVLMRLMGHRNVSTTAVYIDANDNMLRNAVELV